MAIIELGKISLLTFIGGLFIVVIHIYSSLDQDGSSYFSRYYNFLVFSYLSLSNAVIFVFYKGHLYQVAVRALALGLVFGCSWMLILSDSSLRLLGWYLAVVSFFHWSEYFITALTNPRSLNLHSFLLDHSREYHLALFVSCVEFVVESFFFPEMKKPCWLSMIGLVLVLSGEAFRKLAMITAASNFNHYVQHVRMEGHKLVTNGVYSMFRHPSYVGWFYWSIGTQVMLGNPISAIGYTYVSWRFFKHRIFEEEISLLNFFGEDYIDYQKRVPTGIPLVEGYKLVM